MVNRKQRDRLYVVVRIRSRSLETVFDFPPPAGKIDGGIDSVATYGDDLRSLTATCYDLPGIVPTSYVLLSGGAPFTRYTSATYLL